MSDVRRGDTTSIPRSPQYLAVPLGSFVPKHAGRSALVAWWHRHDATALTLIGLLAAAAALTLAFLPRPIDVAAGRHAISIGTMTLHELPVSEADREVFTGPATIVVTSVGGHRVTAGVTMLHGEDARGTCSESATTAQLEATCQFTIGSTAVLAHDVFDTRSRTWLRTYSDGMQMTFDVPAGADAVAVPLPLGR